MSRVNVYVWIAVFAVVLFFGSTLESPVAKGLVHGAVIVSAIWVGRAEERNLDLTKPE